MKNENWASPDVCQKLKATGITINTDFYWFDKGDGIWSVEMRDYFTDPNVLFAVSMAELWRELPTIPYLRKCCGRTEAWYNDNENVSSNTNPADALAELLIWVNGDKK